MPIEKPHITIMNRESEYLYGEQVVYRCADGYEMVGPDVRTCVKREGAVGKWKGFDPFCTSKFYIQLHVHCTYLCTAKYWLFKTIDILQIYLVQILFTSLLSAINCGDPGLPAYGQRNGTNFGFGGVVTFSCGAGYKLMGYQSLKCMATGKWLGQTPSCVRKSKLKL